ncbi:MAG: glycosyltransferase family 1 protein, partial [Oscillospiraceae bacterium]
MNIAFDAGAIEIGKGSGIGNYTLNQFERMIQQTPENEYFYFNTVVQSHLMDGIREANFHYCFYDMGSNNKLREYNGVYREIYGELVRNFLRHNQIDIFYITAPFFCGNVLYEEEWFRGVTVVATAWDIIPYVMKDLYLKNKTMYEWYMSCIDMLRWTDRQLAISSSVKEDMVRYLHFDPAKINIIYGGVSERFCEVPISPEGKSSLYKKFGITSEFILCCVSADARKNVQGAMRAFSKLPKTLIAQYQLVIVGRMFPKKKAEFENLISSLQLNDRVILTDYVSDEEMVQLYNLPKCMIFPSLYEGFGLPALESWACGTPVIASNNSSLGEIVGDAGLLFDPTDISDMAKVMETALTTADLPALLEKGRAKVKQFTWDWVAELTLSAIATAVSRKECTAKQPQEKIALIYPTSNLGEIWDTLPTLISRRFTVDVYADYELSNGIKRVPVKQLLSQYKKYHTLISLGINAELLSILQPVFAKNRNLWMVAEECLENLLHIAAGEKILAENAVSDAGKCKLSCYFHSVENTEAYSFDRVVTASDVVRQALLEQSLACPVYDIFPLDEDC